MKNILLAFVCLLTMSFKGIAGNGDPKCCTSKCSKECVEMCKKNNCTDKDCCKDCTTKGCQSGSCCLKDKAANSKTAMTSTDTKADASKGDTKASCCKKDHK